MFVAPSDHVIPDLFDLHTAVNKGLGEIEKGQIVTFGVKPERPETGYGYLELEQKASDNPVKLKRFVEKPDRQTAEKMFATGRFLWNAGLFLFRASDVVDAFHKHAPDLVEPTFHSVKLGCTDFGFWRLDPTSWDNCETISFDYAIMEKINNLSVVPYNSAWSDLGDWESVWRLEEKGNDGVVASENAIALDCKDVLLRSEGDGIQLVGMGLQNIVVVAMADAVLVMNKDKTQDVKEIVATLKQRNERTAVSLLTDYRPWGWFEVVGEWDFCKVKRIHVNAGARLSLQSHRFRSEHWIVIEGRAKVTVGQDNKFLNVGESVHVPVGITHRMENPDNDPMVLIEVQTGSYLGEDDIKRYEDIYQRK